MTGDRKFHCAQGFFHLLTCGVINPDSGHIVAHPKILFSFLICPEIIVAFHDNDILLDLAKVCLR